MTVNIARFPPMPILSESVAVSQNIGAERRFLNARRIASPIGFSPRYSDRRARSAIYLPPRMCLIIVHDPTWPRRGAVRLWDVEGRKDATAASADLYAEGPRLAHPASAPPPT